MHDCRPLTEEYGTNPFLNGTVWKAICEVRSESGWSLCTLNDDHGVGVLMDGYMEALPISKNISYQEFSVNMPQILNLMDESDFKNFFK